MAFLTSSYFEAIKNKNGKLKTVTKYNSKNYICLHEPVFRGNEKKYLECNVSALDLLGKKAQSQNSETEEYNQAPMSELNDEIPF